MRDARPFTDSVGDLEVHVRAGTADDAGRAARLHVSTIDEGFLSHLGPRFVERLYRRTATSPHSFVLVAVAGGAVEGGGEGDARGESGIVGFVAGSLDVGALYRRFLLRDGALAALSSVPTLVRRWRRALETLLHGRRRGVPGGGHDAELLAMAVDPQWQGRRVGAVLVAAFLAEVARRGGTGACVVVGADNARAISLYRRTGFSLEDDFELHRGTRSLLLRRPSP
jgi:ribosomal protein S18 acetylase RimI-like enzyme